MRWVSLERGVFEKTVEIAEVLVRGVDVLIFVSPVCSKVFDGLDFFYLEASCGIFGVIEIVAKKVEGFDGAIE